MLRRPKHDVEGRTLNLPGLSRGIIEASPLPMAAVEGKKHIVRHINPSFCRLVGKKGKELIGYPFAKAVPEAEGCISLLERVSLTGKAEIYALENQFGSDTISWSCAVWPVLAAGEKPAGLIIQVTDMTEATLFRQKVAAMNEELLLGNVRLHERIEEELRKANGILEVRIQERTAELAGANKELREEMAWREKAEELLRQAQKMEAVGTLAGGIAHDFNNMLAAIAINADIALHDLSGESKIRKNLELIVKAGQHGRDLVRQMLLFSRKSEKKQEVLTLTPLIKETFKLLRSSIPTTIQMELLLETESDAVSADPSQIQQVIMNLCTNAAYAMRGTTGSIDISLQGITFGSTDLPEADMQPGEYLVLSVKDTGSGMDEEVKKRIFEPFFTTKPTGEGTGLGLSVVYGIVKSHKGGISVYSEPDKGSVFKVFLPKAATGVPVRAETSRPVPRGNERILFVDDDEIIVNSVRNMLQRLGYRITALADAQEALKLFSENPSEFDLVITDHTMPRMTGEALGKEMMRIRSDISIILCTAYNDLISSEKAIAMGFRGFIMKPFNLREGSQFIRNVLDQSQPK